jgi:hypothetical protein
VPRLPDDAFERELLDTLREHLEASGLEPQQIAAALLSYAADFEPPVDEGMLRDYLEQHRLPAP